ncbi:hypothetical protein LOZ33_001425 [Ophidiomyces ophidiicola]|nr:hypothetical protein LOZ33_001425 [Ophidiomyces ophidiicola]
MIFSPQCTRDPSTITALVSANQTEAAVQLYTYLISKPEYSTPESRQRLVRRLREALFKIVCTIGVARPLEVIFSLSQIERPEDRDLSFSRENWQSGPETYARGKAWLDRLYGNNINRIADVLGSHQDFLWLSYQISYGLYLSDHSIINDIETELVVLSSLVVQNMKNESHWHLRGIRRVGVAMEDVETIHQCIDLVAAFARVRVDRVPRVADIEHEV